MEVLYLMYGGQYTVDYTVSQMTPCLMTIVYMNTFKKHITYIRVTD